MVIHNCRIRRLTSLFILLVCFFLVSLPSPAEYLFNTARQFYLGENELIEIRTADINNDGMSDLVGLCEDYDQGVDNAVVVRLGTGDGEFADPVPTLLGQFYGDLRTTMLNNDPYPDLMINRTTPDIRIMTLLGNGDGTFSTGGSFTTATVSSLQVGDFTGDGLNDLAIPEGLSLNLYVGQGDGTFLPGAVSSLGWLVSSATCGDFDEDGDLDLASTQYQSPGYHLTVLFNHGAGNFTQGSPHVISFRPDHLAAADLNGNGHLDILGGKGHPEHQLLLRAGNGDGTFQTETVVDIGDAYQDGWSLGDLDNDGDIDIVLNGFDFPAWRVVVVRNRGDGTFFGPEYCFGWGMKVTLDDMDGDGNLDAVMITPAQQEHACVLLGRGNGSFRRTRDFESFYYWVYCVAVADLNGDGNPDILAGHRSSPDPPDMEVMFNQYPGGYSDPVSYNPGVYPYRLSTGDLDGDGYSDILVVGRDDDSISVMLNGGDGTLLPGVVYGVGSSPEIAALGDLDGDGDLDAAVIHRSSQELGILLNHGDGTFGSPLYYTATTRATAIVLGDVDGDGDLDAAVDEDEAGGGNLVLLKNNGDGSFAAPQRYDAIDPAGVDLDDHDGDGDLDLATGSVDGGVASVLMNNGDGTFAAAQTHQSGHQEGFRFTSVDINLDGAVDLLILSLESDDMVILLGEGDGTFGPPQSFSTGQPVVLGQDSGNIALADLDNDQNLEVAMVTELGFQLLYNNSVVIGPADTVQVAIDCTPNSGALPFATQMTVSLTNLTTESRRAAAKIDVLTGNGITYTNWRAGWTNLDSAEVYSSLWNQNLPAHASVVGNNVFTLTGADVTPAPYNQPPFELSGDTDSAVCTVQGISP